MDSSRIANVKNLKQDMVYFNPIDNSSDNQVTLWPTLYNGRIYPFCDEMYHMHNDNCTDMVEIGVFEENVALQSRYGFSLKSIKQSTNLMLLDSFRFVNWIYKSFLWISVPYSNTRKRRQLIRATNTFIF